MRHYFENTDVTEAFDSGRQMVAFCGVGVSPDAVVMQVAFPDPDQCAECKALAKDFHAAPKETA